MKRPCAHHLWLAFTPRSHPASLPLTYPCLPHNPSSPPAVAGGRGAGQRPRAVPPPPAADVQVLALLVSGLACSTGSPSGSSWGCADTTPAPEQSHVFPQPPLLLRWHRPACTTGWCMPARGPLHAWAQQARRSTVCPPTLQLRVLSQQGLPSHGLPLLREANHKRIHRPAP